MPMEMMQAHPIDVLLALIKVEESIQALKAAVVERVRAKDTEMSVATDPFRPGDGPLPPRPEPPYTGCWPDDRFMVMRPLSDDPAFDINTYTQQLSGFLMGLQYGLEHDQGPPTEKTS